MDELKLLTSKIADLGRLCLKNSYPAFSKFLDEVQYAYVSGIKSPGCSYVAYGGYTDAQRVVLGCFPDGYYDKNDFEEMFPLCTLELLPSDCEGLTHRDYLGSLMGLGIRRECLGDIVLFEKGAYLVCLEDIAAFVLTNCDKIGKASVTVHRCENVVIPPRKLERRSITAASDRIDCIIAGVVGCSRIGAEVLIRTGKVFINGFEAENGAKKLKSGDKVSVRGFGKFVYLGENGSTKKGRLKIEYNLYK